MQTFWPAACLDVENCVRQLVLFGVAEISAVDPPRYKTAAAGRRRSPISSSFSGTRPREPSSREDAVCLGPTLPRDERGRDERCWSCFEWILNGRQIGLSVCSFSTDADLARSWSRR